MAEISDLSGLGLETSDEEIKQYGHNLRTDGAFADSIENRLLRDINRLITALSEARAHAEQREAMIKAERDEWDASEATARKEERERIKQALDTRLNDSLCEMKPNYDDSIVGFNEAWDIIRAYFARSQS